MREAFGSPFDNRCVLPRGVKYRAFTIGHDSDFDQVLVNGRAVAAGRITLLDTEDPVITSVYGWRIDPDGGPATWQAAELAMRRFTAHVIGFECGETPVNPGPRPAKRYRRVHRNLATVLSDGGGTGEEFFVPFMGRRHATVKVTPYNTGRTDFVALGLDWARYHSGIEGLPTATLLDDELGDYDLYGCEILGTYAAPKQTAAVGELIGQHRKSNVWHIGGTDSAEQFDIIDLTYGTTSGEGGATNDVLLEVIVSGEQGVG